MANGDNNAPSSFQPDSGGQPQQQQQGNTPASFQPDNGGDTSDPTAQPQEGVLGAVGNDVAGMFKGQFDPKQLLQTVLLGPEKPLVDGIKQLAGVWQQDQQRKQQGASGLYRAAAAAGTAVGVNVLGMEQAAARGDIGGVIGHTILPAAIAIAGPAIHAATGEGGLLGKGAVDDMTAQSSFIVDDQVGKFTDKLLQAGGQVRKQVGELVKSIASNDESLDQQETGGKGSIPLKPIEKGVREAVNTFNPEGAATPKLNAAIKMIDGQEGSSISWETAKAIRSEVGSLRASAVRAKAFEQAGALSRMYGDLSTAMGDRADQLGLSSQFDAFNKLHSTMSQYYEGLLGDITNADNGVDALKIMKDPSNRGELSQLMKDLSPFGEQYGLKPSSMSELTAKLEPLYRRAIKVPLTMEGRMTALAKHPLAAGSAAAAAYSLPLGMGPKMLAGLFMAASASEFMDRVQALRAIKEFGGPFPIEGKFGSATDAINEEVPQVAKPYKGDGGTAAPPRAPQPSGPQLGGGGQKQLTGNVANFPVKVETDNLGIRWASTPDSPSRVSIPKSVADADVEAYARPKLAEQSQMASKLQAGGQERSGASSETPSIDEATGERLQTAGKLQRAISKLRSGKDLSDDTIKYIEEQSGLKLNDSTIAKVEKALKNKLKKVRGDEDE